MKAETARVPPHVDLASCSDTFVTGLARIETLPGGYFRLVWFVDEADDGEPRIVVDKMIVPADVLRFVFRRLGGAIETIPRSTVGEAQLPQPLN